MTLIKAEAIELELGEKKVLDKVNLEISPGEFVGIVGPNGSGKTSLLKVLSNLIKPTSGRLFLHGSSFDQYNSRKIAQHISYLPHNTNVAWPLTVYRVIALGLIPYRDHWEWPTQYERMAIDYVLGELNLTSFVNREINELSAGERARVMLARSLVGNPKLLLADEPVAAVDPYHQLAIMEAIKVRVSEGASSVVAIHDLTLANRYCDKLIMILDGSVISEGKTKNVLTEENIARAFKIEVDFGTTGAFQVVPTKRIDKLDI